MVRLLITRLLSVPLHIQSMGIIFMIFIKDTKVLDYCNENDISGYMVYEENKHNL